MKILNYKSDIPIQASTVKQEKLPEETIINIPDNISLSYSESNPDCSDGLTKEFILQRNSIKRNGLVIDTMKDTTQVENNSSESPFPCEPKIEHEGKLVKIIQEIDPDYTITGLNELVSEGRITSYLFEDKNLILYADSEQAVDELKKLKVTKESGIKRGVLAKALELLVPPELEENCAPEYIKYRIWCLLGTICSGAIGFMNARVNLDAIKIAFTNTEKAALSGVVNGMVWKATAMGGSFLSKKGDADPKKFILASSLINTTNSMLTLGTLCIFPAALPFLSAFTTGTSAIAGSLGSAAGVNIFNHMAKGPAKGLVSTKNSNQDMVADMFGMPLAMALTRAATSLGINPYLFTVALLGSLLTYCNIKSASSIRMNALNQANIEKIIDNYMINNQIPEAEDTGIIEMVTSLFKKDSDDYSKKITFVDSFQAMQGDGEQKVEKDNLFRIFKKENYIVNCKSKDNISVIFKNKATIDDILKSYLHGRLIEKGLSSSLFEKLEKLYGNNAQLALIELSYRAMPPDIWFTKDLDKKGWNSSTVKFDITKLNTDWTSHEELSDSRISMQKFLDLAANPSENELKALLDYAYGTEKSVASEQVAKTNS